MLSRWNVRWVIVRTTLWHKFFRTVVGGHGEDLGPYEVFDMGGQPSRFVVGTGEVRAAINCLELRNVVCPKDYVVIRYRYHPGWVCDAPGTIEPFPTPDHSGGLLLIRHPSPTIVLRFNPSRALRAPWPTMSLSQ
jgi:hypothetical protein